MEICTVAASGGENNKILTPEAREKCALALGNFDGVHIAHTALLEETVRVSRELGCIPAVFTFSRHSRASTEGKSPALITVGDEKLELFESCGIKRVYIADFDALSSYSPKRFVDEILKNALNCAYAVCGFNFRFGHLGAGTCDDLKRLMDGCVTIIPPVLRKGVPVSSTLVREAVEKGDMELARELLGRPFFIYFPVVHGKEFGRTIDVPTINQNFPPLHLVPAFGVYACMAEIEGRQYTGAANVGVRPTVENGGQVNCETHILNFTGNLYGERIKISFYKMIRGEKRFGSVKELKAQILHDIDSVNDYFGG